MTPQKDSCPCGCRLHPCKCLCSHQSPEPLKCSRDKFCHCHTFAHGGMAGEKSCCEKAEESGDTCSCCKPEPAEVECEHEVLKIVMDGRPPKCNKCGKDIIPPELNKFLEKPFKVIDQPQHSDWEEKNIYGKSMAEQALEMMTESKQTVGQKLNKYMQTEEFKKGFVIEKRILELLELPDDECKSYEFSKFISTLLKDREEQVRRERNREIVICAAVLTPQGDLYRGHRHSDCFHTMQNEGKTSEIAGSEQGFVTSLNRFVTREEGRKIQDAAGIKSMSPEGYMGNTLFSEDLY